MNLRLHSLLLDDEGLFEMRGSERVSKVLRADIVELRVEETRRSQYARAQIFFGAVMLSAGLYFGIESTDLRSLIMLAIGSLVLWWGLRRSMFLIVTTDDGEHRLQLIGGGDLEALRRFAADVKRELEPASDSADTAAASDASSDDTDAAGLAPSAPNVVVPEGHEVHVYGVPKDGVPNLVQTRAGLWLAYLGSGDDQESELPSLFQRIEEALRPPQPQVLMTAAATQMSDLFAPSNPPIEPMAGGLIWTVDQGSLLGWIETPTRLQALIAWFHRFSTLNIHGHGRKPPLQQFLFVADSTLSESSLVLQLLRGLGIAVHRPQPGGEILAEVKRPEGVTIAGFLVGEPIFAQDAALDDYPRTINQAKDQARLLSDTEQLARLEDQERKVYAQKLTAAQVSADADDDEQLQPLIRAPRLRRLLLRCAFGDHDERPDARRALFEELLHRRAPFLLMTDAQGVGEKMSWPERGSALPAYSDLRSVNQTVEDTGRVPTRLAVMAPRKLFVWALEIKSQVALNAFRDATSPTYMILTLDELRALAAGKLPADRHDN